MKEIVVISGKGGTGKTSLTASFAVLAGEDIVVADCDVDAADMHVFLQPDFAGKEEFFSGQLAVIDPETCIQCGKCADVCRFDAITVKDGIYRVNALDCEGCAYCSRVCPVNAIRNRDAHVGWWYRSHIRTRALMVHASMKVGAENSGKLVAHVKKTAKRIAEETRKNTVLVDGSPGIGCPVVSSLSGADYVVLVTEPTVSGLHDLLRVQELVERFGIPSGCIINKSDLNREKREDINRLLREKSIDHLADIPYDETFTKAMIEGKTMAEFSGSRIKKDLEKIWENIQTIQEKR